MKVIEHPIRCSLARTITTTRSLPATTMTLNGGFLNFSDSATKRDLVSRTSLLGAGGRWQLYSGQPADPRFAQQLCRGLCGGLLESGKEPDVELRSAAVLRSPSPWYDTQNKIETIIPGEQSQVFPLAHRWGGSSQATLECRGHWGRIKYDKFAPRWGFAYAPTSSSTGLQVVEDYRGPGKFSIRGGFGASSTNNFQDESGFVEIGDAPYGLYYQASTPTMLSSP